MCKKPTEYGPVIIKFATKLVFLMIILHIIISIFSYYPNDIFLWDCEIKENLNTVNTGYCVKKDSKVIMIVERFVGFIWNYKEPH